MQHGKVFFGHIYILALVSIFCMYLLLNLMTVRPHRPSNVTREFPPSLLMLQGGAGRREIGVDCTLVIVPFPVSGDAEQPRPVAVVDWLSKHMRRRALHAVCACVRCA